MRDLIARLFRRSVPPQPYSDLYGYWEPLPEAAVGDEPVMAAMSLHATYEWQRRAQADGRTATLSEAVVRLHDAGTHRLGFTDPDTGEYVQGPRYRLLVEGMAPRA